MRYRSLVALAALCLTGPASAATYSVATSGSDGNDGTSASFRTLQKAVSVLRDGDSIVLESGTYTAGAQITQRNVTVTGKGTAVLDGSGSSRIDGLTVYQASNVTLEN